MVIPLKLVRRSPSIWTALCSPMPWRPRWEGNTVKIRREATRATTGMPLRCPPSSP